MMFRTRPRVGVEVTFLDYDNSDFVQMPEDALVDHGLSCWMFETRCLLS